MKTTIAIVPRLPPIVDGVGDYASLLANSLKINFGISTQFIACDPQKPVKPSNEELSPIQLPDRSRDALLSVLDRHPNIDTILLHYVGYGYAIRGCPHWLVPALSQWRQAKSSRRLITMFHEVYASSYLPWSSQFWTSPIQQQIARNLINLSDAAIASNQLFANSIQKLSNKHDGKIDILPVFSTVGECLSPSPLTIRQPWLVTFGNSSLRKSIYTDFLQQLAAVCQQLEIKEIYDIGHNSADIVRSIPAVKVNAMGILPATEIAQIFSNARVGFINYPIPYVAKSTIFAAYCAHQLLSVFTTENISGNQDGIELEKHYWSIQDNKKIDIDLAQTIANNAHQWYCKHSLAVLTSSIANLLQTY